jgi:hypothetical protein
MHAWMGVECPLAYRRLYYYDDEYLLSDIFTIIVTCMGSVCLLVPICTSLTSTLPLKGEQAPYQCYRLPYDVLQTTSSSCIELDHLCRGLHTLVSPYAPILGIVSMLWILVTLLIEEPSSDGSKIIFQWHKHLKQVMNHLFQTWVTLCR